MKSSPKPKLRLSFMISNGKQEMNSTIYPVPKNDSANNVSSEPGIFWGSEKISMKHLGFSPFIKEQRIGEKRIPNSNLIYRIVWNFLLWNHLILHVLVCVCTLACR